jgi:uncharacterized coiled-coil protein SlyX
MQQIDEIRRMSELAKQMRELGLAKDNSEAFQQARSVTSSDPAVAAERKQEDIIQRLVMLERKVDTQARTIDDLKAQLEAGGKLLAQSQQQIKAFDAKIRDLEVAGTANIAPIPAFQPQAPAQQTWNQPFPPQMQTEVRAPSTVPIDRNGVAPADVSVDKFFYFGNKC